MNEYKTRLDEIRARCEAATPGPWKDDRRLDDVPAVHNGQARICDTFRADGQSVLNAEFIAHAREDNPYLLAMVETLRAGQKMMEAEMERLTQERDAAISDLRHADNCDVCKNNVTPVGCDAECLGCQLPCVCRDCRDESLWQWRGPEPGGEEKP